MTPFKHWTPPGTTGCPELGSKMNPKSKFDPVPASFVWKVYAGVTFGIVLAGVDVYLGVGSDGAKVFLGASEWSDFWFSSLVASGVVLVVLWSLITVSTICTLGVEGCTSTRRSIMWSEVGRHGVVVMAPLGAGLWKGGEGGKQCVLFAGVYAALAFVMLMTIRGEPEKREGVEGNDLVVALIGEEAGRTEREREALAPWSNYTGLRYR